MPLRHVCSAVGTFRSNPRYLQFLPERLLQLRIWHPNGLVRHFFEVQRCSSLPCVRRPAGVILLAREVVQYVFLRHGWTDASEK